MPADTGQPGNLWLTFALMTVASWGLYGIFLHSGQMAMSATMATPSGWAMAL